ncbi:major facilitator superfamily MFS_1 [Methanoregula boonei 6A8]|uniref:Major facilitator superfamily MFS_1 n=1 Tax=Methanoregula boonei (strain DSM 21154 / JCM 14090 / 6A8) TaxID=456442 RepID=A7IAC7_METB6|nr:MFS transporter [Methanoregula boonei]ABS56688.1 major facilitator superfamily MFS_1 [Methanoregula boonei 6A8]
MSAPKNEGIGPRTIRKVSIRLLPFLILLYVIAYLDRVNFGFAALEMNSALGLSSEIFGFLSGIFFIGYLLFELPSNLILQKIGARIWITRILISWGIVVIVTAFATDAVQLAVLRFVLGVMEAGFFPGILLYLTYWFREREQAKAVGLLMSALAISTIVGAPVSTWILDSIHWLGMAGWRWLFVLEGLPAIILGVVTYWYLTDRPEDAAWLDPEERDWLAGEIKKESRQRQKQGGHSGLVSVITDLRVWHLALIYCMLVVALYGLGFWMPQIIRSMHAGLSNTSIGLIMTVPYACAGVTMILWSRHSDLTGERRWHTALPPLIGGIALAGSGIAVSPPVAFLLLIIATMGIFCAFGPFWALPALFLAEITAAAGIAVINSIGNLGGFVGPTLMGYLTQVTGSTNAGLIVIGAGLVLGGAGAVFVSGQKPDRHT